MEAWRGGGIWRLGFQCTLTIPDLHDERDIGIVVVVASARHLDELVRQLDVLRVDADVVGGGHGHQRHRLAAAQRLRRPRADRPHELDGGKAVVGDQDAAHGDARGSSAGIHGEAQQGLQDQPAVNLDGKWIQSPVDRIPNTSEP